MKVQHGTHKSLSKTNKISKGIMGDSMCSTGETFKGNRRGICGSPRTGMTENGNTNRTKERPYGKDVQQY
jgi:hypothetical protein